MGTPVVSPSPEPQVQTAPTQSGTPQVPPVQPRNPDGTFAPAPQVQTQPAPAPVAAPAAPVVAPATPAPPAAAQPYAIEDLGNGRMRVKFNDLPEVYEGTQQEILPKVADALYNTKKYAAQLKNQPPATPQQTVPVQNAPATPPASPQSPFSDPTEEAAARQLADLQAKWFGFQNAEAMREHMNFMSQTTEQSANRDLNIQFQAAQPDFNPTPENAEKLVNAVAMLVPKEESWTRMPLQQQLSIMRAAHAYNISNKVYDARPAQVNQPAPAVPAPPPIPTSTAPRNEYGNVPPELIPSINDTQAQILEKINKAKQMGYLQ